LHLKSTEKLPSAILPDLPDHGQLVGAGCTRHCGAADVEPEPVEWLWPGRVAIGKQTLIAGEAGLGKSQVAIAMVAAVTTGGTWPCYEGRAPLGNVIILSAEYGAADTVIPRLMAARADLKRVHLVSSVLQSRKGHRGRRPRSSYRRCCILGSAYMVSPTRSWSPSCGTLLPIGRSPYIVLSLTTWAARLGERCWDLAAVPRSSSRQ